ncbi:MAG: hypothetical protein IJD93_06645 [Ruminococcus sp.]|nr:hypothetical protein [Ruminococcus sp.]
MKKILALLLATLLLSALCVTSVSALPDGMEVYKYVGETKYIDEVVALSFKTVFSPDTLVYGEIYEYYSEDSTATGDEVTPDYVLVEISGSRGILKDSMNIFGNYVLYIDGGSDPFVFNYGVYIPAEGKIYDLVDAWEMGLDGIEKAFTESGIGILLGDMDKDRTLTVKDATYIQKCIAELQEFANEDIIELYSEEKTLYISDFNRDGVRNVKDATAIQKYIAGLEY